MNGGCSYDEPEAPVQYAISIRQPWAWLILHAGKDIENRSWKLPERFIGQRVLIHAGKAISPGYVADVFGSLGHTGIEPPGRSITYPGLKRRTGGIVGSCIFVGCTRDSNSPWAFPGEWHWQIAEPRVEPFRPLRGQLGFFPVERVRVGEEA